MRRPSERGAALLVLMLVIVALGSMSWITYQRAGVARFSAAEDLARTQALWLARSAATRRISGTTSVRLERSRATVATRVSGSVVTATATIPGSGTARVRARFDAGGSALEWTERFDGS